MKQLIDKIHNIAKKIDREINLMEVCGTHTQTVVKNGIRQLMPKNVNLLTGPGCPVCVTDQKDIDNIVTIAFNNIPIATYGDLILVPGNSGSLEDAKAKGAKIFAVYSTDDALALQKQFSNIVFFGLGFETTTPMSAYAIKKGLTVYSSHKLFLPAMEVLLANPEIKIDGFINPGHVSAIIGTEKYHILKAPQVITGFEAKDVLIAIYMLLKQIQENRADVENQYTRVVTNTGNKKAYDLIFEIFETTNGNWRGLGEIPNSGLEIKEEFKNQNAKVIYKDILDKTSNLKSPSSNFKTCKCGKIIQGLMKPNECPMFAKTCTPENPVGPCMVSVEGACNVEFEYR